MSEKLLQIRFRSADARGAFVITHPVQSVIKAYSMTRSTIKDAEAFNPEERNGLYFLVGDGRIYTGKTEQGILRIKQHAYHKDWWDKAIMFLAPTEHFSSSLISELERYSIEYLLENSPYKVENGQGSGFKGASEFEKGRVKDIFEDIKFDMEFLGVRMTKEEMVPKEEAVKKAIEKPVITYERLKDPKAAGWKANSRDISAAMSIGINSVGEYVYIIEKGSEVIFCDMTTNARLNSRKKEMIADGRISECRTTEKGKKIGTLTEEVVTDSPSAAYCFLVGGNHNGWDVWRNGNGEPVKTIREAIQKKELM